VDGAWLFIAPGPGWIAFDLAGDAVLVHHEGAWLPVGNFLGPMLRLGVNTAADDVNRLAVRTEAVLLTAAEAAEGGSGDLRIFANKEAEADTVSLLFQSGFSGRAEIGLAGDDDLVVKVSGDGASWTEAMRVDRSSGYPSLRYDNADSGLVASTLHEAIDEIAEGSVLGPASAADGAPVLFDGTSGRLVRETSFAAFKSGLALTKADIGLGSVLNFEQREKLAANRTYYVRADGSNANDGLANTSGGAFLTLAKAVAVVAALDRSTFNVTIEIGAGTFAGCDVTGWGPGSGQVTFNGAGTASTTISTTSDDCFNVANARCHIQNLKMVTAGAFGSGIRTGFGADVSFQSVDFGSAVNAHIWLEFACRVRCVGGYAISGGAIAHVLCRYNAVMEAYGFTITLSGTPAFSSGFMVLTLGAAVEYGGNTFSGSATGPRYYAGTNAVLSVSGGGASYLPGSSAGSVSTGGQYV
ncbi:MAG: hypothetical protein J0H08_16225, partial [Rhizobiales bacterium]|nr:hypothetical protein [Hyphomicrobiales bacterium]